MFSILSTYFGQNRCLFLTLWFACHKMQKVDWPRLLEAFQWTCWKRQSAPLQLAILYTVIQSWLFHLEISTLESGINIPLRLLIFGIFFQGLWSYYGLKRLKFYYISLHILRGYVYSFCQIFQRQRLFKGLRLFVTLEYLKLFR